MEGITFCEDCPKTVYFANENQSWENQMFFEVRTTILLYCNSFNLSYMNVCYIYNFLGLKSTKLCSWEGLWFILLLLTISFICKFEKPSTTCVNNYSVTYFHLLFTLPPQVIVGFELCLQSIHTIIRSFTAMS